MKRVVPVIAGAAVLALANVALAEEANLASADQPILLTDAQMDGVTAGVASAFIFAQDVDVAFSGLLLDEPTFAFATISADVLAIKSPDPFVFLEVVAVK